MKTKPAETGVRMVTLDVTLLGRDYKIACKEGEEAELMDAVEFLDGRMREIRETGKTTSVERIAVMAALNLAHDFRRGRAATVTESDNKSASANVDGAAARRRIASMKSAIDAALAGQEKLL